MLISDAKAYVGHVVRVTHTDRSGREYEDLAEVFEVNYVPLYGPCLITDTGEIRLDRIVSCQFASIMQQAA